ARGTSQPSRHSLPAALPISEERRLVAMVAGEPEAVARARALLRGTCKETFDCGPVPNALRMKLAVNLFMIVMVTGLVEAFHFAEDRKSTRLNSSHVKTSYAV